MGNRIVNLNTEKLESGSESERRGLKEIKAGEIKHIFHSKIFQNWKQMIKSKRK